MAIKTTKTIQSEHPILSKGIEYARDIDNGKIIANDHVRKLSGQYLEQLDRTDGNSPFVFHADKAARVCHFLETLTVDSQTGGAAMMELLDWQVMLLSMFYGFRSREDVNVGKFNEVLCIVGRKGGKSQLVAGCCLLELFYNQSAEVTLLAPSVSQAQIIYEAVLNIKRRDKQERFKKLLGTVNTGKAHWKEDPKRQGIMQVLASGNEVMLDGLKTSQYVIDESHGILGTTTYNRILSGGGSRMWVKGFLPSTGGTTVGSLQSIKRDEGIRSLDDDWDSEDRVLLPLIYEASSTDDMQDPKTWELANPSVRHWRSLENFYRRASKAISTDTQELEFACKLLNVPGHGNATAFCNPVEWDALAVDKVEHKGTTVMGLDLSSTLDMTAFSILSKEDDESPFKVSFDMHCTDRLIERLSRSSVREKIKDWRNGDVTVHPDRMDNRLLAQRTIELVEEHKIDHVILDTCAMANPYLGALIQFPKGKALAEAKKISHIPKYARTHTAPIALLKDMMQSGKGFEHQRNVVADFCAYNAQVSYKVQTMLLLKMHRDSPLKIDAMDALVTAMAFYFALNAGQHQVSEQVNPVDSLELARMIQGQ